MTIKMTFETIGFKKVLKDSVAYSMGFLEGVQLNRKTFNTELGMFIEDALKKFIDAKARANPSALHHVYEWGATGDPDGRLFYFDVYATATQIAIRGGFEQSRIPSPTGTVPFFDKANVMENGIAVTIVPVNSKVLVFEVNGETVFTTEAVYVAHPGGDEVAGSFGQAIEEFFGAYLTGAVLAASGIYQDLENASEFSRHFAQGAKGGGRGTGIMAGRKYLSLNPEIGIT